MRRLLIASAAATGAVAAALPAVAGLNSNPSFSHKLPVHVPSQAQVVQFDDHGRAARTTTPSQATTTPSSAHPGDDHGGSRSRTPEPGDDRGGSSGAGEPGDDSGGHGGGPGRGH